MDSNYTVIIDFLARIIVPIVGPVVSSIIVAFLGKKITEKAVKTHKIETIVQQAKELGYSEEEYAFIEKVLKEVYSKPPMRW